MSSRRLLLLVAGALAVLAAVWVVTEPFGKGSVLVSVSESHGLDTGDLPALGLLAAALGMAVYSRRRT